MSILDDHPTSDPTGEQLAPRESSLRTDEPSRQGRGMNGVYALVAGLVAVVTVLTMLAIVTLAIVSMFRDDSPDGAAAAAAPTTQLDVSLSEFGIDGDLTAPAGDVVLNVVNAGAIEHNLSIPELGIQTANLTSRGVDTLTLDGLEPGTYEVICTIPGHAESGMKADLVITAAADGADDANDGGSEGDASGASDGAADHSTMDHSAMTAEEMDMMMVESMLAFPAETEGKGNQVLEPEILPDGTKKFTLVAEVIPWEVSPGEFVDAWAYNNQVPGPQIKVDIGDRVQVELTNLTPMATDIHFHGIDTPNDQDGVSPYTQDPIANGETFTYEFVPEDPAIGMYHAHLHGQTSVVNGMFAAFIVGDNPIPYGTTVTGVEIPADLEPVFEQPMVLNDAGTIGLSLNGKSFPATEPIVMNEGDWGVIHYFNEGLTAHPMHLHKFPQLVYAKDGIPLDQPYWADTINIAPGERYSVLFQADAPGTWVYHCHILTHVERTEGMFGMATAVIVNPADAT